VQVADPAGEAVQGANHVAFNHDGGRVYVSSINEVVVMDPAERQVLNRLPVGQEPHEFSLQGWISVDAWTEPVVIQAAADAAADSAIPGSEDAALDADDAAAAKPAASAVELTQVNDERSVSVTVTPLNLASAGETLDFRVALDTHVVELDYDLASSAVLRDAEGNEYTPVAWDGPLGGHHVTGVLKFDGRADILAAGSAYLELELRGIADVPSRVFRWEIGR
jgi:hypothetical protein